MEQSDEANLDLIWNGFGGVPKIVLDPPHSVNVEIQRVSSLTNYYLLWQPHSVQALQLYDVFLKAWKTWRSST
jgi:hypothetical protein